MSVVVSCFCFVMRYTSQSSLQLLPAPRLFCYRLKSSFTLRTMDMAVFWICRRYDADASAAEADCPGVCGCCGAWDVMI
jgi:hypothetical protein